MRHGAILRLRGRQARVPPAVPVHFSFAIARRF